MVLNLKTTNTTVFCFQKKPIKMMAVEGWCAIWGGGKDNGSQEEAGREEGHRNTTSGCV